MVFSGMTVTGIRELSRSLSNQSAELSSIRSRVDRLVAEASQSWEGADIARFRNEWYSNGRSRMQIAAQRLSNMATHLDSQAREQEETSNADTVQARTPEMKSIFPGLPSDSDILGGLLKGAKTVTSAARAIALLRSGYSIGWMKALAELGKTARHLAPLTDQRAFRSAYSAVVARGGGFFNWLADLKPFAEHGKTIKTVASVGGRVVGGVFGGLSVITGTMQVIQGNGHEGWVDVGDRVSGGLAVIGGGASVALAIGGAALLATPAGPVIAAVAVGATLVSAAWDFAQWCNDGGLKSAGDSLSNWSQGWKNSTQEGFLGDLQRGAGTALDAIGSGISTVGSWLKGLW